MANQETGNGVHPLVAAGEMMVVPGVYDVLSAKLAERAGFPVVVLTGYGVAASFLGEPDFGLLTQSEILDTARRVTAAVGIGVIVTCAVASEVERSAVPVHSRASLSWFMTRVVLLCCRGRRVAGSTCRAFRCSLQQ